MSKKGRQAKGAEPQGLTVSYFSLESVIEVIEAFPQEIEAVLTGLGFEKGRALRDNFPLTQSLIETNARNLKGASVANGFARLPFIGNQYVRHGKIGPFSLAEKVNAYFGRHIARDGSFAALAFGFTDHDKEVALGPIRVSHVKTIMLTQLSFYGLDKAPRKAQELQAPENSQPVSPSEYTRHSVIYKLNSTGITPQIALPFNVEPGRVYALR